MTFNWFWAISQRAQQAPTDVVYTVVPLIEGLSNYFLLAPMFLFWHFFDFIEKSAPKSLLANRLTRYRAIFWLMLPSIVLLLLMAFKVWQYNSCDELPKALFHQCVISPSLWLLVPWMILMGLAFLACISKAGYAIASHVKKS